MDILTFIRGAGDLASGVALRLHRAGFRIVMSEVAAPLAVRRTVSFSESVYLGQTSVEEVTAVRVEDAHSWKDLLDEGRIPVVVDPDGAWIEKLKPDLLIDARMRKKPTQTALKAALLVIGLGPGFTAGEDCHAVVETLRGHRLGRVIWHGSALPDTGEPDAVLGHTHDRVLRAGTEGELETQVDIGELVVEGQVLGQLGGHALRAPISGVVRGILRNGTRVTLGLKIGDIDPRSDASACYLVSDKTLAVGGGVLEAVLSRQDMRARLGK